MEIDNSESESKSLAGNDEKDITICYAKFRYNNSHNPYPNKTSKLHYCWFIIESKLSTVMPSGFVLLQTIVRSWSIIKIKIFTQYPYEPRYGASSLNYLDTYTSSINFLYGDPWTKAAPNPKGKYLSLNIPQLQSPVSLAARCNAV